MRRDNQLPLGTVCRGAFDRALAQTVTLDADTPSDPTAINVTNMVASVHILSPGMVISPKRLVLAGRGAVKYAPSTFQAVVLRFGGRLGNATGLVSVNGKLTIVGAKNRNHARFAAQQYRLFIEQTHDMEGKSKFAHFEVYNTVVQSVFGFRPNLSRLQRIYPDASEWEPGLFPGLILQVWLYPKAQCACQKKQNKLNDSCKCNATCLAFDSGKLVITGIQHEEHAASVCNAVRLFFSHRKDELNEPTAELPKHLRFEHRKRQQMRELEIDFLGTYKPPTESAAETLDRLALPPAVAPVNDASSPIIKACRLGQTKMVQFIIGINPGVLTDSLRQMVRDEKGPNWEEITQLLL